MAFTNLTSLTKQQYDALNPSFSRPPDSSRTGNPDPRVTIQLGGWVSDSVMAFEIITAAGADTGVRPDPSLMQTLDLTITAGTSPMSTTTYWTVNTGTDTRTTDWAINFQVDANGRDTGTWVFTKGKIDDDKY